MLRFFSVRLFILAAMVFGAFVVALPVSANTIDCVCQASGTGACYGSFTSESFIVCTQLDAHESLTQCGSLRGPRPALECPGAGNVDTWLTIPVSDATTTDSAAEEPTAPVGRSDGRSYLINPLGGRTVPQIIGQMVAWFGTAAGALFMLYLLWGGAEWMTARGDQAQAQRGRQRIVGAVAGIAVVLFAYILVSSVITLAPK